MCRTSSAHEEGGERVFSVNTQRFVGKDGAVDAIELVEVEHEGRPLRAGRGHGAGPAGSAGPAGDGLPGPQPPACSSDLGVEIDSRGNVVRDASWATTVPGVFVAGDMGRGQSLIVWAIAEGRAAAAAVDAHLTGFDPLPAPVLPTSR